MMRLAVTLALAALLAGCQSSWTNRPHRAHAAFVPGKTTREEVVAALGTPQVVRIRGDHTVLTWTLKRYEGSGLGVGSLLANFSVGDGISAVEKIDVVFGPDGRVTFVRQGGVASVDRPGPWPFGD